MSNQHLAAISPSKGSPLIVEHRPTPTPGPHDLLIEVKSIALNPIDHYQRDYGMPPITHYPAVLGSDIAGTVLSAGSSVAADAPKPGTRVAAFAPCFFTQGAPDYGSMQARALVPAVNAAPPPQGMSFNEACSLPMAVATAWAGWYTLGVPRETSYTASDKKGMLVWGAASSVVSAAVQLARAMGFSVYASASEKHHAYIKSLGASRVFDYRGEGVVGSIVAAANEDGVTVRMGFDAVRENKSCMEILNELKGEGTATLASARPLSEDSPKVEGVKLKFVSAPAGGKERTEHFHFVFNVWLKEKLEKGEFVPSPKIQVVEGGLEGANKGLDELKKGVSG
jgi:NADPH:quinone reductase-like Zn-dependent oxidoreductase